VDEQKVAEGHIPETMAYGYSLDETFDIGCDMGSPVTDEYKPLAEFTGRIIKVDFDLKPDLHYDAQKQSEASVTQAMARQ